MSLGCLLRKPASLDAGSSQHKIGPYSVVDDFLCYGSQQILNPAMTVICDGECCIVPKIGEKTSILKWHTNFLQLHPEAAKTLFVIVLEKERISADDVCTIFNAVMNTASEKIINAIMSEDEKLTREYIKMLQQAGY